jgi:hypothetical protein
MKEIIQKVLIIAFAVGLTISFLFGTGGLKSDADTMKGTTTNKINNADTQLKTLP